KTDPPKTDPPKTDPPKTDPPKTEQQTLEQYLEQRKKEQPQEIYDYDMDFIPDHLEIYGYTTEFHMYEEGKPFFKAYPWRSEYDQDPRYSNYQKYVSNPFLPNTAGDPYTDLEKAGQSLSIQGKVLEEAYHPLVAACPSAAVFMEDVTISPNITTEMEMKSGVSYHTNYGLETLNVTGEHVSVSQGTHLEFNGDLEGYRKNKGKKAKSFGTHASGQAEGGVYISETLTHSNEQTVTTTSTVQDTHKLSEKERTTMNSMDSGNVSGVIRYRNMGTAPMEQIKPNLSFLSGDKTVTTFTPQQKIDFLPAGEAYPAEHLAGIRVSPADLLNGHTTSLNKDQMKELTDGNPIKIQATQITGKFKGTGEIPRFKKGELYDWAEILPGITQRTARLVLEIPENMLDRRIAAPSKDTGDAEYYTPPLTLEQALQIAFGAKRNNRGELVLKTKTGMVYNLDRASVNVYVNKETDALIVKKLEEFKKNGDFTKSIYDVPLQKEMAILIKPILEINAFLNNGYIYIENQMDESMFYEVWREDAGKKIILKQGIVPSASTIGTGYFCGNPAEELSIMVSRQVSQVIFKGNVSDLENRTEQLITKVLSESPAPTRDYFIPEKTIYKETMVDSGHQVTVEVKIGYNRYYFNAISFDTSEEKKNAIDCEQDKYMDNLFFIQVITTDASDDNGHYAAAHSLPPIKVELDDTPLEKQSIGENSCGRGWTDQRAYFYIVDNKQHKVVIKKRSDSKVLKDYVYQLNPLRNKWSDNEIKVSPFQNIDPLMIAVYKESNGDLCIKNKKPTPISFTIINQFKESFTKDTIEPGRTAKIKRENHLSLCTPSMRWDSWNSGKGGQYPLKLNKYIDDRIIIIVNDLPVYDAKIPEISEIQRGNLEKCFHIDYWHLNGLNLKENGSDDTYDYVSFKLTNLHDIGVITSYEIKINKDSIGTQPMRALELDKKQIINFFDYKQEVRFHPKKGDTVEIIAHDIFGNTTSVFKGMAELSENMWIDHYQVSEWHKKDNHFDALYLSPVPTGFTESVKSYDIQIGSNIYESVSLERQDNGGYIRDQRLKLDFAKKIPQEKLPQLGDSITLTIHTLENQTVTINLGQVQESQSATSINALEKVHEIIKWKKDGGYYTRVQFNTGSKDITSYGFKVNNHFYGEIPVSQVTKELDFSKLKNDKKIQKGDYVEIYAFKTDGEGVLIQSRYAGTEGLIGTYPITDNIKQESRITNWTKDKDRYTTFTLNIADSIDSYIKKYEGCINNHIINLTPNGLTFTFDTDKAPRHGDIVQLFAYTYSGEKIELWKLPAGAIGKVNDEEIHSIHQPKEWTDTNKTIVFDTSKLQDPIQAHVKSYTVEVWKGPNTNWETFGSPIQMNAQGQLRLQDCNAPQSLPQPPNAVRVIANLVDPGLNPVVVMVRKVGEIKPPPTQKDIEDKHKDFIWNFDQEKLKSITFPHVDSETASYIASYQVNRWSELIGKITFQVDNKGVTVVFEKLIDVTKMQDVPDGPGKTKQAQVTAQFSAFACCINIEKETKLQPILVIGSHTGEKGVTGITPVRSISKAAIVQAHDIVEGWIYQNGNVTMFYFNQKVEPYLKEIQYYSIKINETEYPPVDTKQVLSVEQEEDKDGHATEQKGLPIRFSNFGLTGGSGKEYPKPGNKLGVIAHLNNPASDANGQITKEIPVIANYEIPGPLKPYLSKEKIEELVKAHQPPNSMLGHFWKNDPNGSDQHFDIILFEDTVKPYLQYIDHYCISINGTDYCPKNPIWLELTPQGAVGDRLLLRISEYGVPYNKRPLSTDSITVFAHLKEDYAPESSRIIPVFSHNTH
ncbi:hypothetical protein OCF15_28200, partial [Bacillus cereus]|nr:hypothetical protein [Bacillus cereus]